MLKQWLSLVSIAVFLLAVSATGNAQSAMRQQGTGAREWVGTWAASPMLAEGSVRMRPFAAVTLREIVHVSNGGQQLRVRFTNEFGMDGLTITDAHVALSAGGSISRRARTMRSLLAARPVCGFRRARRCIPTR